MYIWNRKRAVKLSIQYLTISRGEGLPPPLNKALVLGRLFDDLYSPLQFFLKKQAMSKNEASRPEN